MSPQPDDFLYRHHHYCEAFSSTLWVFSELFNSCLLLCSFLPLRISQLPHYKHDDHRRRGTEMTLAPISRRVKSTTQDKHSEVCVGGNGVCNVPQQKVGSQGTSLGIPAITSLLPRCMCSGDLLEHLGGKRLTERGSFLRPPSSRGWDVLVIQLFQGHPYRSHPTHVPESKCNKLINLSSAPWVEILG